MLIEPQNEQVQEQVQEPDPYGDVALGVECAWPENIPVLQNENPA